MRKTPDLGIKVATVAHSADKERWTREVICPLDVKKMFMRQARMAHSKKKWAAKHECEELKGGVWLDPIQALL